MPKRKWPQCWCTYILCYPDGSPYYVGVTRGKRIGYSGRNKEATEIASQIKESGGEIKRIVEEKSTKEEALDREYELIQYYGRRVDGGILTNLRIGGQGGVHGRKLSEDQIAKMKVRMLGRKIHSEENRKKMSIRMKGNNYAAGPWTEERRRQHSENMRRVYSVKKEFKGGS